MEVGHRREASAREHEATAPSVHHPEGAPVAPPELLGGLRLLGLSSREAGLYLALGRVGPLEAGRIAEETHLHRATTYRVISRLVRRGLIAGSGGRPQLYSSLPPEVVLRRLGGFLREAEEVVQSMGEIYARWAAGPLPAEPGQRSWLIPPRFAGSHGSTGHPVLAMLAGARQSVELMFPASNVGPGYRNALAVTLSRIARSGVRTRVLTDATVSGRRFEQRLARDLPNGFGCLEARHYTPAGAHFYLIDTRLLVRCPAMARSGSLSETAIATDDPLRARMQLARFESLWTEAVPSTLAARRRGFAGLPTGHPVRPTAPLLPSLTFPQSRFR